MNIIAYFIIFFSVFLIVSITILIIIIVKIRKKKDMIIEILPSNKIRLIKRLLFSDATINYKDLDKKDCTVCVESNACVDIFPSGRLMFVKNNRPLPVKLRVSNTGTSFANLTSNTLYAAINNKWLTKLNQGKTILSKGALIGIGTAFVLIILVIIGAKVFGVI